MPNETEIKQKIDTLTFAFYATDKVYCIVKDNYIKGGYYCESLKGSIFYAISDELVIIESKTILDYLDNVKILDTSEYIDMIAVIMLQ